MKKWLKIPLVLLCAVLVLIVLAAGLSRVVYGRSLQASVYEVMLRRRFATDRTAESEIQRLEALRDEPEKTASLPKKVTLRSKVESREWNGMRVFALGGETDTDVLYLHGGAYINGINAYQWRFMDDLAAAGCRVIAPAYHLAPWSDYTRAYDDLCALYREMVARNPDRRLILMGDSAGGGLALGLAEALVQAGDPLPERLVLFSPWVDVSMENPDIAGYVAADPILHLELVKVHGQYWANGDTHYWQPSPLFGDMAGLPSVTIYCGTRELLYPDILLLERRLGEAGVEIDMHVGRGLNHDYPLMPIPEGQRAAAEVRALVAGQ